MSQAESPSRPAHEETGDVSDVLDARTSGRVPPHAVAVIGMAGRFPDAPDLQRFWSNLTQGVESLTLLSDAELQAAGVPDELIASPNYVKKATRLDGADQFDAGFFGFNAREAEVLDPQQRIFLECAWTAMEDAGYVGEHYPGPVAVYAGASINTYLLSNLAGNPAVSATVGPYQVMISNDKDFLATRVSYKLNLRGPGITVQTACSTSLVAVQMAWQSLLDQQCDLAIAGGVSVVFPQNAGYLYQDGMIFSPDGHCRPFDARGQGIRPGSGAGVVVLKRLRDAIADGDSIRAVILGAAINNDGADKMGYTAPSADGQAEVIAMAQARAGVDAETIRYVEAHGTATPLGDPIEVTALTQAFRGSASHNQFCALGSVKSNLGHLDAAAGVTGLIKTVLSLGHQQIPPTLHYEQPNPQIDFANSPFYVNNTLATWPKNERHPRRAGVSSFGIGGTNAHVVLEEAPDRVASDVHRPSHLLVLSARSTSALDIATENLAAHLEANPHLDLADVAYTLQVGRKRFEYRRAIVCHTVSDAVTALRRSIARHERAGGTPSDTSLSVAFLLSGQGSQYVGMARALYDVEPTFREVLDDCAERLAAWLGQDVRELIFAQSAGDDASSELNQTRFAQPALFVVEYALAKTLMAWGIVPSAMLGHSIGEYVAACLSGVASLDDALRLVAERGRLMQSMPPGRMIAVPLPESEVTAMLRTDSTQTLSLAAVNGPRLCVVAGPHDAVAQFEQQIAAQGIEVRHLHTSHAFHSGMMDPILPAFEDTLEHGSFASPTIPFVSNLTGTWATSEDVVSPSYWSRHLRGTVRFADGVRTLTQTPEAVLVEVGPGNALSILARQSIGGTTHEVLNTLPHPLEDQADFDVLLHTLGKLWTAGADIRWDTFHRGERLQRVPLPTYPFERERYLIEPQSRSTGSADLLGSGALQKQSDIADWFYVPSWKRSVGVLSALRDMAIPANSAWLVFIDETGLGDRMVQRLRSAGHTCLTVSRGSTYAVEGDRYTIRPTVREDYLQVVTDALSTRGLSVPYVVHLWSVDHPASLDDAIDHGLFSVVHTIQALSETGSTDPVALTVVSSGTQRVLHDEPLVPEKSLVIAPSQVVAHEIPFIRCRSVDVIPSEVSDAVIEQLLADVIGDTSTQPKHPAVFPPTAYRGGFRWTETVEQVRLGSSNREQEHSRTTRTQEGSRSLRHGGVYFITGGLGGIGLKVADFLARTVNARLILTTRSSFPNRDAWEQWITDHGSDDSTSQRIQAILELESIGASVLVLQADASDRAAMTQAVSVARERFGDIHGVFHAAGLPGGSLIAAHDRDRARNVLAPKVEGTLILETLFASTPLDFLVLFSSINAILGLPGGTDYTAANRFLDTYAQSRASAGHRVISVDWDAWRDVGMVKSVLDELSGVNGNVFQSALTAQEGLDALQRILETPLSHVAVVTRDFPALLDRARLTSMVVLTDDLAADRAARAGVQHSRPDLAQQYTEPRDEHERFIAAVWQDLLGIDRVGIDDNFFELGGHSLIATGMFSRLQQQFQVQLPLRTIFETPTIRELAERVAERVARIWINGTDDNSAPTAGVTSDDQPREEFEI